MSNARPSLAWFEKSPDRFAQESAILQREGFVLNKQLLKAERRIEFGGHAKFDGRAITVRFPEGFPSFPPKIVDTAAAVPLVRHHNPLTREFCLFGPGSSRWSASLSVDVALAEVEGLLRDHSTSRPATDFVPEPTSAVLNYQAGACVLVGERIAAVVSPSTGSIVRGQFVLDYHFYDPVHSNRDLTGRGVVSKVTFASKTMEHTSYRGFLGTTKQIHGELFCFDKCPRGNEIKSLVSQCWNLLSAKRAPRDVWIALVFPEDYRDALTQRLTWIIAKVLHTGKYFLVRTFVLRQEDRTSRTPGLEGLSSKNITMVGCGCLGSKIATALAASGVKDFHLVDPDFFDPNNAIRHECGVEAFGVAKIAAVRKRLFGMNPAMPIDSRDHPIRIGMAFSPDQHDQALRAISNSDLVIDTTGSHSTSRFLNEFCFDAGVPLLCASVTNGAWGGEIVRVVPRKTPCWLCWMHQYYNLRPVSTPVPAHGVFHPGCDQPSFTGTTFETGIVANVAAWNAVEILLRDEAGRKDFPSPYLVFNGRAPDGSPLLHWESLPVNARPTCTVCGTTTSTRVSF